MQEQLFLTPKDKLGYAEEYIIVEEYNQKDKELLKYSLSNNLDDIQKAIFARTGKSINLDYAVWVQNKDLSESVKHLMNKHHVTYSMTAYQNNKKIEYIYINMRVGDKWFYTYVREYRKKGRFYSWYNIAQYEGAIKVLIKLINDTNIEDTY